jgi:hypothetical protein
MPQKVLNIKKQKTFKRKTDFKMRKTSEKICHRKEGHMRKLRGSSFGTTDTWRGSTV